MKLIEIRSALRAEFKKVRFDRNSIKKLIAVLISLIAIGSQHWYSWLILIGAAMVINDGITTHRRMPLSWKLLTITGIIVGMLFPISAFIIWWIRDRVVSILSGDEKSTARIINEMIEDD